MDVEEDAFPEGFDKASFLGEALSEITRCRMRMLGLRDETRANAVDVVARSGFKWLEEPRLWLEWLNDVLSLRKGDDSLNDALRDPDVRYLEWIEGRAREPFKVSFRAVQRVAGEVGQERANRLLNVTWPQELAWAHRMRGADDDRVSVIASIFISMAQRDASAEFRKFADSWLQVEDDRTYSMAYEHEYDPDAIRAGLGGGAFEPVFLRRGQIVYSERLERMDAKSMRATAERGRRFEREEMSAKANRLAAEAVMRTSMARIVGVIQVAIEVGLGSDDLVEAQERFVGLLNRGEFSVQPGAGLPYREFVAWLRVARHVKGDVRSPADALALNSDVLGIVGSWKRWVDLLPADYRSMGASEVRVFREWAAPIVRREREIPRDVVSDYGFHLVARTHRIGAT